MHTHVNWLSQCTCVCVLAPDGPASIIYNCVHVGAHIIAVRLPTTGRPKDGDDDDDRGKCQSRRVRTHIKCESRAPMLNHISLSFRRALGSEPAIPISQPRSNAIPLTGPGNKFGHS